jgi:MFS family permease
MIQAGYDSVKFDNLRSNSGCKGLYKSIMTTNCAACNGLSRFQLEKSSRPFDTFSVSMFCVVIFLFWAAVYIYVPILPVYAKDAGASLTLVGLIGGVYGFSQLFARIPLGVWSDRIGQRKPFIAAGLILGVIGGIGLALGYDPFLILLFRGVHGLTAAVWVNISVMFASYFPTSRTTAAMSIISFINAVSMLLATYAGGVISFGLDIGGHHTGRGDTFWLATAISGMAFVFLLFAREEPNSGSKRPAMSGQEFLAVSRVRSLVTISAIAVLAHFIIYAVPFTFVPIYAKTLGATDNDLGLLTTALLGPYTIGTLISAAIAARLGDKTALVAGLILMGISMIAIPLATTMPYLMVLQGLAGFGRGLIYPVMMATTINGVAPHQRATAMGIFQAVYAVGMFLGPASAGFIAQSTGLTPTFLANGLIGLVAASMAWWWVPGRVKPANN